MSKNERQGHFVQPAPVSLPTVFLLSMLKRLYFPLWDRADKWRVEMWMGPRSDCERGIKRIRTSSRAPALDLALVHEMAHTVTADFHGKRFYGRWRKAARDAQQRGQSRLAGRIENDVSQYQAQSFRVTWELVESIIVDAHTDCPTSPADDVLACAANGLGMLPEELRFRYRAKIARLERQLWRSPWAL